MVPPGAALYFRWEMSTSCCCCEDPSTCGRLIVIALFPFLIAGESAGGGGSVAGAGLVTRPATAEDIPAVFELVNAAYAVCIASGTAPTPRVITVVYSCPPLHHHRASGGIWRHWSGVQEHHPVHQFGGSCGNGACVRFSENSVPWTGWCLQRLLCTCCACCAVGRCELGAVSWAL